MGTWIDFKELRQQLRFQDVLRHYGVQLKVRGERASGFCPLPGHRNSREGKPCSPSFSVHLPKGIFHCFSCGAKGNAIDFACRMEGLNPDSGDDVRKAALLLHERFATEPSQAKCRRNYNEQVEAAPESEPKAHQNAGQAAACPAIVNAPLDFELRHLDPRHPYLAERGFTAETIVHFGLGYCAKGLMQARIAIPLHDAAGTLIGYAGRLVDDQAVDEDHPKYRFPGRREQKGKVYEFQKTLLLYNAHRIDGCARDLIVVEGFTSVWWLHQQGWRHTVALMGSSISQHQIDLLCELLDPDGRIWVFTDGDDAGRRCAAAMLLALAPHRSVRWAQIDEGQQPTDLRPDRLARLLPMP